MIHTMCESSSKLYIGSSCGKNGIPSMRIYAAKISPPRICAQNHSFIDHLMSNCFLLLLSTVLSAKHV